MAFRRFCRFAVIILFLTSSLHAVDDKKPKDKDDDSVEKKAKDKLVNAGRLSGKLLMVEGSQKYLTLEITSTISIPNPASMVQISTIQRQISQVNLNPYVRPADKLRQIAPLYQQMQMAMLQANTKQKITQKVELQATDDMKVRIAYPPADFDEKGNPKKYTAKELKALKGKGNLWGYPGDFDSLKPDQVVEVYLKKTIEAPSTFSRTKEKKKEKDVDQDFVKDDKPVVAEIHILAEPKK